MKNLLQIAAILLFNSNNQ